jgi:serine/threonine protein kinase/tetratricopeptide (TPR) repeat protein
MQSVPPASHVCPQCGGACTGGQQYCAVCGFPVGTLSGPSDDKLIGKTLPGGYHILDLISVGGMGRVYRAEQSVLGRTVAVKVIHPHLLWDENSAARFLTEARAASKLNHPNSIAVFDFGRTDDGQPYQVMEFLRGKDLARVAYEEAPLPYARIVDVLRQVLAALAEAHELGIVHRDLKPENIMLEPLRRGGDFVKVLDFGLAKVKADATSPNVTSPGIVCGTPDYMSPEQGRGDPIDGRSDLYSVGVILYQLLTGRLPFEAESPTAVVMMHLTLAVPDPRRVAGDRDVPGPLVDVVMHALRKEADQRYQDAIEFSEALQQALLAVQSAVALGRPSLSPSTIPPSSLMPGNFVVCPACGLNVPLAKFCCECAAPLRTPSGPPDGRTVSIGLCGRESELGWLTTLRRQVVAASGARLVGEHGAGKTRLLQEFAQRAETEGDLVVWTGPDPYWAEIPCHLLRVAVRELGRLTDGDIETSRFERANSDARRGLDEIMAGVPRTDERRTPAERRHALAEALRWAAVRSSELGRGERRTILIVDELHRVDAPSRFAIGDLLAEPPPTRLLVVSAHVPGFDPGWGGAQPTRLLGPLSGLELMRSTRTGRASGALRAVRSREILPLYADQLVHYAAEVGGEPPTRLADLIAQRLEVLQPNSRLVLQALAVLGDQVEPNLLGRLLPKTLEIEVPLNELEQAGLVEADGALVSMSHPLLHEIVLSSIPAAARRDLHARALDAWEKRGAPLEVRALHAYYAQDPFRALLLLEQVAERAAARGDTASEVLALRRGLELSRFELSRGELDDPLGAMVIFGRKLGSALVRAGDLADAEGVLREALDVAGPSSSDRARVLGTLAQVAQSRKRPAEAIGYIDQAIEVARRSGAHELASVLSETRAGWVP